MKTLKVALGLWMVSTATAELQSIAYALPPQLAVPVVQLVQVVRTLVDPLRISDLDGTLVSQLNQATKTWRTTP